MLNMLEYYGCLIQIWNDIFAFINDTYTSRNLYVGNVAMITISNFDYLFSSDFNRVLAKH